MIKKELRELVQRERDKALFFSTKGHVSSYMTYDLKVIMASPIFRYSRGLISDGRLFVEHKRGYVLSSLIFSLFLFLSLTPLIQGSIALIAECDTDDRVEQYSFMSSECDL